MKVLQVGSLNIKEGGPPYSMSKQIKGLEENGISSICLMPPCPFEDIIDKSLQYHFTAHPLFQVFGFQYIPSLRNSISHISDIDIIHLQGTWSYFSHFSAKYAYTHSIPFVIAPRGALYRFAIKKKWLKKKIAWYAYEKRDLSQASCLQVTCEDEMVELRSLGLTNPIAIVPNPYDMSKIPQINYCINDNFVIGYIGRLHERKHVEKIIYALNAFKNVFLIHNVRAIIIGSGDKAYESFLRKECDILGLTDQVEFTGFLRAEEKDKAIRRCHVFAFPSDFENWGNVIPDVLARGVPAITTMGMPWRILKEKKCGWWIPNNQREINNTLFEAYNMRTGELEKMGQLGRELVKNSYSVSMVGGMLKTLYNWILNGGDKPDFVYI